MVHEKITLTFLTGWGFESSIWNSSIGYCDQSLAHTYQNDKTQILIAWSLGGLYAIDLAYRFPERIKKLILVSSLPKFVSDEDTQWQGISQKKARNFYQRAHENINGLLDDFMVWVQYPNTDMSLHKTLKKHLFSIDNEREKQYLCHSLQHLLASDYREIYRKLSQPVVHIFGEKDAIIPAKSFSQIQEKKYMLPRAGHVPFLTHTKQFIAILKKEITDE